MILISDSHVDDVRGNHAEFFEMLDAFSSTDQDIIFLGDIFDLWIGFPRYEKTIHHRFLSWCREQRTKRIIGFVEGNHEYFVVKERKSYFTWCTDEAWWQDENGKLFVHGDQVNRRDSNYLRFRKIAKNNLMRIFVRIVPFGPAIGIALKRIFKKTNLDFRKYLPEAEIRAFSEECFAGDTNIIFMGHFHQKFTYQQSPEKNLFIIPSWAIDGQVGLFHEKNNVLDTIHWKEAVPGKMKN